MVYGDRKDVLSRLKLLLLLRVAVITILLGSLFLVAPKTGLTLSIRGISCLIMLTYLLTIVYALLLNRIKNLYLFSYLQIIADLLIESGIIFCTGGVESPFIFLYILSIIAASILIYRRGGYLIASLASILYGTMANLELYHLITPLMLHPLGPMTESPQFFLYKVGLTISAFFLVASLSGYLAENLKRVGYDLEEMEEQVRRADRLAAIGRMAAGMAHELRNPLASISGSIQLLKDELPLNGDHQRLMDIILTETERLDRIIKDFLAYARPTPPQLRPCQINGLVEETVTLIKNNPDYSTRGIDFQLSLMREGDQIWADPDQLKQVLWNLCINAIEAMPAGGQIGIITRQAPNPWRDLARYPIKAGREKGVEVIITDTGMGIDSKDKAHIFDPFFTTKTQGSGLGLAIVHRIIEEHGGYIKVDSNQGEGAAFHIWLPCGNNTS